MTSVLNVGVMRGNPVGNQIRFLQNQLDVERKNYQMLLSAVEAKAPEVYSEYARMKQAADDAANPPSREVPQQQRFVATQPVARNPGGRF